MASVLLTRPRLRSSDADELHRGLRTAGIAILELPMIRFEWPDNFIEIDRHLAEASRGEFDAIMLSSPTAVNFFEARARELGLLDAIRITSKFGAVGAATAKELLGLGIDTAFPVPTHSGASQLAASLQEHTLAGKRVLLLQSQIGLDTLQHGLREIGAEPIRVTLYRTEGPSLADAARLVHVLESEARPSVVAFSSPSAVHNFVRVLAEMSSGALRSLPALAVIGETTAKAVEESLHHRPEIVARKSDQASLAEDIIRYLQS